jgi:hypothetical protein
VQYCMLSERLGTVRLEGRARRAIYRQSINLSISQARESMILPVLRGRWSVSRANARRRASMREVPSRPLPFTCLPIPALSLASIYQYQHISSTALKYTPSPLPDTVSQAIPSQPRLPSHPANQPQAALRSAHSALTKRLRNGRRHGVNLAPHLTFASHISTPARPRAVPNGAAAE